MKVDTYEKELIIKALYHFREYEQIDDDVIEDLIMKVIKFDTKH